MSRELSPRAAARLAAAAREDELAAERYELRGVLGRGGMGVVHEAWDRELERVVALKVLGPEAGLAPEARARFVREARAAARLTHPHLAAVYDAGPDAIAMQRIVGVTLAESGLTDPRALAALIRDAALAIHYAHGEGLVHRDLKPGNLMVTAGARPHVYVMDFGLAKELRVTEQSWGGRLSRSGQLVGTPAFMAPEQTAGGAVDARTDVYGLGATLYTMLAGRPPFEEGELMTLLRRVAEEQPAPLEGLDRDLATIVAKCLEKEPARRYPSALALASDLERWLAGAPIEARPPTLGYRLRRLLARRQGQLAAAGFAALLVALVALPFVVRARALRDAAEESRAVAEEVLRLSEEVREAISAARAARASGVGQDRQPYTILQEAVEACRAFLERREVAPVWLYLGRLLREQGRTREALDALDRAAAAGEAGPALSLERGLVLAGLYRAGVPVLGEEPPAELERWRARGLAELERALADPPAARTAARVYAEALRAWLAGELVASITLLREVLELDLAHRDAHLALARLYLLTDRDELGLRHSVVAADLLQGNRPAYLVAGTLSSTGAPPDPARDLLRIEGCPELLLDFQLVLQLEPGDAATYGLRAQVRARRAWRARLAGELDAATAAMESAEGLYSGALTLRPELVAARVGRGAARAALARWRAAEGASVTAWLAGARDDYEAALAARPALAAALHDRALLERDRARYAQLALRGPEARAALERAGSDAEAALAAAGPDHPWRARFAELAEELRAARQR